MRYLLNITLASGDTLNTWVDTERSGRILGKLLSYAEGVANVELHDTKTLPSKVLVTWGAE